MKIADLTLEDTQILGDPNREVTGVDNDSRSTSAGELYAAFPGANVHGAKFAPQLVEQGVTAFLTDPAGVEIMREAHVDLEKLTILVHDYPRAIAGHIAAQVYGTGETPTMLAVTGTNGKTTTTFILDAFLQALGHTTGLIGTVSTVIAGDRVDSVRTTPEAPALHQLFAQMRAAGVDTCSMEVSSHALSQHRVDGAHFAVAGFTNLSQDHLDYHGTMEAYFNAKATLFTPKFASRGVIVLADEWAHRMVEVAQIPVATVSLDPEDTPDYLITRENGEWTLETTQGSCAFTPPLPGLFNVTNTALALAMLLESGIPFADVARVAQGTEVVVPGRMEVVHAEHPRAIIDYSHTPDAIAKVLDRLEGDPVVIVVGAGGDRDSTKRDAMGAAAAEVADVVIVTDDNPRSEDPAAIRAQVLAGARGVQQPRAHTIEECADRGQAIRRAVELAGHNGTIVVAGKGHETGQEVAGKVLPFSDREQTREAIEEQAAKNNR